MNTKEYLDLVDENDQVIGRMEIDELHEKELRNFRASNLFIVNRKGELWIPRRQPTKKRMANCLDMSMGGHVSSGETYDVALRREAMEELQLDLSKKDVTFLGRLSPYKDGVYCFQQVYEIHSDEAPNYNREDFSGYEWLKPDVLLARIASGDPAKSDLAVLVKKFYTPMPP